MGDIWRGIDTTRRDETLEHPNGDIQERWIQLSQISTGWVIGGPKSLMSRPSLPSSICSSKSRRPKRHEPHARSRLVARILFHHANLCSDRPRYRHALLQGEQRVREQPALGLLHSSIQKADFGHIGRKPVDPPPVVQLIDRRRGGRQGLYDSELLNPDPFLED